MSETNNKNDFPIGGITRIRLKDFTTYEDVELYPGRSLNIIIGPNGSGKSTFVKAMILGLGGQATDVIDAKNNKELSNFIKPKREEASIEIELYSGNELPNVIIKRSINSENETTWRVNDDIKQKEELQSELSKFNIKLTSISPMLQQMFVTKFANDPSQILRDILSAVGDDETIASLNDLKNYEKKITDCKKKLNDLNGLMKNYESISEDVINNIIDIDKKIKICDYQIKQSNLSDLQKKSDDMKINKTECSNNIDIYSKSKKEIEKNKEDNIKELKKHQDLIEFNFNSSKKNINTCKDTHNELLQKRRIFDEAVKKLSAESINQDGENKINIIERIETFEEIIEIDSEKKVILKNIENDKKTIEKEKTILKDNRLNILKKNQKYKDIVEAVTWLRSKKDFQSTVCEPMMLEMEFRDGLDKESKMANYVETLVDPRILTAFIFTDKNDLETFRREAIEKKWRVTSILASAEPVPESTNENIGRDGFYAYLLEGVVAPEPARRLLYDTHALHRVPLSDCKRLADDRTPDDVPCYFTDQYLVSGGPRCRVLGRARRAALLAGRRKLNELFYSGISTRELNLKIKNKKLTEFLDEQQIPKDILNDLDNIKTKVQSIKKNKKIQKKTPDEIKDLEKKVIDLIKNEVEIQRSINNDYKQIHRCNLTDAIAKKKLDILERALKKKHDELKLIEKDLLKNNNEITKLEEEINSFSVDGVKLFDDPLEQLKDLKEKRNHVKVDAEALKNFKEHKIKTDELEKFNTKIKELNEKCSKNIKDWVEKINKYFSEWIQKFGRCGQIEFIKKNKNGSEEYGIDICVCKSHESEPRSMRLLSSGEKELSTAMVLLAVQRCTPTPFRWLDEIHQGLDKTNEKKIVEFLNNDSNNCQSFFLTCKMLPEDLDIENDLHDVMIHTIMNGKIDMKNKKWNFDNININELSFGGVPIKRSVKRKKRKNC